MERQGLTWWISALNAHFSVLTERVVGTSSTYSEPSGQNYWYELQGKINRSQFRMLSLEFQESAPSKLWLAPIWIHNDSFSFPHQLQARVLMPASTFVA